MTGCDQLSERMPIVAAGRSTWSADEVAHLTICPDCTAELRLVGRVRQLGDRLPTGDPAAITLKIRERMAGGGAAAKVIPLRSRRRMTYWGLALAAAAAAVLAVAVPRWRSADPANSATGRTTIVAGQVLSELDDLSAPELEALLREFSTPPGFGKSEPAGTGDLNAEELERVLRSWEG